MRGRGLLHDECQRNGWFALSQGRGLHGKGIGAGRGLKRGWCGGAATTAAGGNSDGCGNENQECQASDPCLGGFPAAPAARKNQGNS